MALHFENETVMYDYENSRLCFTAADDAKEGHKLVRCLIPHFVLALAFELRNASPGHVATMFQVYREGFERIAARKYQQGAIEPDGSVAIWPQDLDAQAMFGLRRPQLARTGQPTAPRGPRP